MTGSRRHDILGKKENNLSNIRALYRFENREELMHAEAIKKVDLEAEVVIKPLADGGEGCLDAQTAMGKAPIGVAKLAKKYGLFVNLNQIYN